VTPKPPASDDDDELLRQQAKELQVLLDDARRLHREITKHLDTLRHAGDPPPPRKSHKHR